MVGWRAEHSKTRVTHQPYATPRKRARRGRREERTQGRSTHARTRRRDGGKKGAVGWHAEHSKTRVTYQPYPAPRKRARRKEREEGEENGGETPRTHEREEEREARRARWAGTLNTSRRR